MSGNPNLDELRREIDRIDDAMHDLIMRRATLIEKITAAKAAAGPSTFIRPGREAAIQRRLAGRHSGIFPRHALLRMWREMINAFTALQGPFAVAVTAPEGGPGYWDVARDHFGSHVAMKAHPTPLAALRAVGDGQAAVAVVPWPQDDDPTPWWPLLMGEGAKAPRVIFRLPFAGRGNGRGERGDALALARTAPEATGQDRSLLALDLADEISRGRLADALAADGLKAVGVLSAVRRPGGGALWLLEIEGFLVGGDPRLSALATRLGDGLRFAVPLGSYPIPLV